MRESHLQAIPAVAAGLIAGVILLIVPHASPWEGLTAFMPAILGRIVPATSGVSQLGAIALHLTLSLIYGFIISLTVVNIRELRAVALGGIVGLALYVANYGVVAMWMPSMKGNEISVLVTHVVFGLIAAGVYRGLLRRRVPATPA